MNRRQRRRWQAVFMLGLCCVILGTLLGMRHTGSVLHTQQTEALGTTILIGAEGSESRRRWQRLSARSRGWTHSSPTMARATLPGSTQRAASLPTLTQWRF